MTEIPTLEFVSWKQLQGLCLEMVEKIDDKKIESDLIVSITRGGNVPARIISDFLRLPVFSVSIQSYGRFKQEKLKMTQKLGVSLAGNRVLLVDEITDTGRTLERSLQYLGRIRAKQVVSVSVYVKPLADPMPDIFAKISQNWVVFPYEVRETLESLRPEYMTQGLGDEKLVDDLVEGGMDRIQVRHALRQIANKSLVPESG